MKFTQDFPSDLGVIIDALDARQRFAFTKFADGERLLLDQVSHRLRKPFEEWDSGQHSPFTDRLREAIQSTTPGFYLGISCPCCSDSSGYRHEVSDHDFYRSLVRQPDSHVTFANVFVNGNYTHWSAFVGDASFMLVSSSEMSSPQLRVPKNAVNTDWDISGLVRRICELPEGPEPVFVAAGPAGSVIVHEAWRDGPRNRAIVDVGSTLDPWIHGAWTRGYHDPNHPNRNKICQWSPKTIDNATSSSI